MKRLPFGYAVTAALALTTTLLRRLCKVMGVYPSGFYAWRAKLKSPHQCEDELLQGLLTH
jgi:hypothetical protein